MQAFSNHRTSCISPASQDRSDREWKSMEPIIELYHNDLSSCAQKVRIALYEKQLPWKSHHLNLRKGDQFKPEYMKLNPNGVVPTLVHRSEEHTSELQSLMRISYAVFCLKKKKTKNNTTQ